MAEGEFTEEDLFVGKWRIFQKIEMGQQREDKGVVNLVQGISKERQEELRKMILAVDRHEVIECAK